VSDTPNTTTTPSYTARLIRAVTQAAHSAAVEASIGIAGVFATIAMAAGAIVFVPLLVGAAGAVFYVAYASVLRLGVNHFAASLTDEAMKAAFVAVAPISAAVTAGLPTLSALGLLLFARRVNNGIKGLLCVVMIAWGLLMVLLAFYESALTFKLATIPPAIVGIGSFLYAALPALGLLPVCFGLAAARNMRDERFSSVFHAAGHMVGVMLESVALIAGLAGESFFGLSIGLDATFVVPAAMIGAFGFVWARSRIADAKKRGDAHDVLVWGAILFVFGGYIGIVTALSVQALSAIPDPATGAMVERLTLFGEGMKHAAENSYQLVLGGFIAASLIAEFLTERHDSGGATQSGSNPLAGLFRWIRSLVTVPTGGAATTRLGKDAPTLNDDESDTTYTSGVTGKSPATTRKRGRVADTTSERQCPECGKRFVGNGRQTYCKNACKQRAKRRRDTAQP
jgi:preprotein translocase subunit YajC